HLRKGLPHGDPRDCGKVTEVHKKIIHRPMDDFLLCKSIAKYKMRHFLPPSGQPKMMRKNFMRSGYCP
ncbi:MAG: hypothetical protein MRZ24_03075, partial [Clostridiales bacterium]|nr:hypothetical protein [Clostridiales bacterium]